LTVELTVAVIVIVAVAVYAILPIVQTPVPLSKLPIDGIVFET
jgi:hypothetical protein